MVGQNRLSISFKDNRNDVFGILANVTEMCNKLYICELDLAVDKERRFIQKEEEEKEKQRAECDQCKWKLRLWKNKVDNWHKDYDSFFWARQLPDCIREMKPDCSHHCAPRGPLGEMHFITKLIIKRC